eukprot:CAMPEP_0194539284 /NCGR_PEP_ID=MMETSP0253-20130528/79198_1 /TAXON_ID=2966 /ORGANISM="Noctiluca scintillans" /LENGTH=87 /DNA_ID=CAMNT_0039385545 /DNA_START=49 /DNA_END=312 /DNA_ORIENTATION=-
MRSVRGCWPGTSRFTFGLSSLMSGARRGESLPTSLSSSCSSTKLNRWSSGTSSGSTSSHPAHFLGPQAARSTARHSGTAVESLSKRS